MKHYVQSSKGDRTYIVDDELNTCSCPDFQIRHRICKHLRGLTEVEKVTHESVYAAIAAAQPEIGGARKTRQGQVGQGRYMYATLADVWDAAEAALAKHGLAVMQFPAELEGDRLSLWTILSHESGTFIERKAQIIVGRMDPQGIGSAITYLRRYALTAVLGIVQEDDDAQSAMPPRQQHARPAAPPPVQQAARPGPAKPVQAAAFDEPWDDPEVQASVAPKLPDDQAIYLIDLVKEKGMKTSQIGPVLGVALNPDNWRGEVAKWLNTPGPVAIEDVLYDRDIAGLVRLAELTVKGS